MRSLSTALVAISLVSFAYATAVDFSLGRLFSRATGCSTTGPASCHNTTVQSNLCCFESPGVSSNIIPALSMVVMPFITGTVAADAGTCLHLQSGYFWFSSNQFWDLSGPAASLSTSWTVHGVEIYLLRLFRTNYNTCF
jgi:hypothetical protein